MKTTLGAMCTLGKIYHLRGVHERSSRSLKRGEKTDLVRPQQASAYPIKYIYGKDMSTASSHVHYKLSEKILSFERSGSSIGIPSDPLHNLETIT